MTRVLGRRSWAPVALLALFAELASSHPQCLDFKPPFKPPRALTFCVQYSNFGCCDAGRDAALLERYYRISEHFDQATYTNCASHLQNLLCQVRGEGGRARARSPLPTIPPPPASIHLFFLSQFGWCWHCPCSTEIARLPVSISLGR